MYIFLSSFTDNTFTGLARHFEHGNCVMEREVWGMFHTYRHTNTIIFEHPQWNMKRHYYSHKFTVNHILGQNSSTHPLLDWKIVLNYENHLLILYVDKYLYFIYDNWLIIAYRPASSISYILSKKRYATCEQI